MSTNIFNVLFLGAGIVNFGGKAGPWNHSLRLEQKLGERLKVVGIIDPARQPAEAVLARKREAGVAGYAETRIYENLKEAGEGLTGDNVPRLAVLGFHCAGRGSTRTGRDAEVQLIKLFPGIALFMEKPLSMDTFEEVTAVSDALKQGDTITSVGYMLRYVKAVQHMKALITHNDLTVMATQARYLMAYEFAGTTWERIGFWDKEKQLGPIVEQATHVCDLSRFFAPSPILDSVQVQTIEHTDSTGKLSKLTIDEDKRVPVANRIPRLTNAMWRYENGACGTLLHGTVLHEGEFSVELAVIADGWLLRLVDPYNTNPKLFVRKPGHLEEEIHLGKDDCYFSEISTMVDVIEGRQERSAILSSFEDAVQSYKLTWAIRWKGEENYRARSAPAAA